MSVDATMAVLYAQTGMATSMVNAAAVGPQALGRHVAGLARRNGPA